MVEQLINYKNFDLVGLSFLHKNQNLLAFSAQMDSTCLFFLLIAYNIPFDIAIINYGNRENCINEINYAKELAKYFNKKIYIHNAQKIKSNFESNAREIRFKFFKNIINDNKYNNLILANQLNDRVEWLLMQLSKGCGLNTLLGFDYITKEDNFNIIRPLSKVSKNEIVNFLTKNNIKYFTDETNNDVKFLRNYFRKEYANKLVNKFQKGLLRSFDYLKYDFNVLYNNKEKLKINNIFIYKKNSNELINIHNIDIATKKCGYVASSSQKKEIIRNKYSCVIGNKVIIDCNKEYIFITKNINQVNHTKKFRNILRIYSIPPKIRPFINESSLEIIKDNLLENLNKKQ